MKAKQKKSHDWTNNQYNFSNTTAFSYYTYCFVMHFFTSLVYYLFQSFTTNHTASCYRVNSLAGKKFINCVLLKIRTLLQQDRACY